jgi:aminomethyltransferase
LLALQGPRAAEALAKLAIQPLQADWPAPTDLYFMEAGPFVWNDIPLGISRSGYTGEDGFEISVPAKDAVALANVLTDLEEVRPIGLGARDSLRLEAGLPLYGHDMDSEILPVEANLSFALSKARREEGNFAGAGQVLAQYPDKADKKRVGLFVDGRQPVREGAVVVDATGATIGNVTSGGFSPTLQRPIAMAYVPMELTQSGTAITVEQRGKKIACTVADMPFVPHHYYRKPKT